MINIAAVQKGIDYFKSRITAVNASGEFTKTVTQFEIVDDGLSFIIDEIIQAAFITITNEVERSYGTTIEAPDGNAIEVMTGKYVDKDGNDVLTMNVSIRCRKLIDGFTEEEMEEISQ